MTIDRRQFINQMGVFTGAAVIATAPWLNIFSETKHTRNEKVHIAVIGAGSRGLHLLDFLMRNPKVKVVAVCDNYPPNLQLAVEKVPGVRAYTDYRKLLENKEIEAVVIATPPIYHAPMTLDTYSAGKHVFLEKAITLEMAETFNVYHAYRNSGKIFFVGHQRFFDPRFIAAMTMIHSGDFGNIQSIRCHWDRNSDWRRPVPSPDLEKQINWRLYKATSKGLMTELACHQLQIGTWAMRLIPDRVMGVGSLVARAHEREVDDNVSCIYAFANGVKMTYASTNSNKFYGLEERILCEKGTFELQRGQYYHEEIPPIPGILRLINNIENAFTETVAIAGSTWEPETAAKNKGEWILQQRNEGDGTCELLEAFAEAVIIGRQPENFAEECYYATQLSLLGYKSMEEDRPLIYPENYKLNYLNHTLHENI